MERENGLLLVRLASNCREGMITGIFIGDVERRIVVGPALGKVHLTAMVSAGPSAQKQMLDINFSKLQQLSIDRHTLRTTVSSAPDNSAVSLDFRAISGPIDIQFADQKAIIEILSCLPISLTQIQDSQRNSQPTSQMPRESVPLIMSASNHSHPQNTAYPPRPTSGRLPVDQAQMEVGRDANQEYNQSEEDIYGEDLSRQGMKDVGHLTREILSGPSALSTVERPSSIPEPSAKRPSRHSIRPRRSVPIVYGRSNRFRTVTPSGPNGKPTNTLSRGLSASSSTGPDTISTSASTRAVRKPIPDSLSMQTSEKVDFDRPPPAPTTKPQNLNQRKSETKPVTKKRTIEASDQDWEPTTKKSRSGRAALTWKMVTFKENNTTTTEEKDERKKGQVVRRQSAAIKASRYGPAEDADNILEESSAHVVKPTSVKRTSLPLSVSAGKTQISQSTTQKDRESRKKPRAEPKKNEVDALKDPKVVSRNASITHGDSSDDPDEDGAFSDEFNYDAMDIDDYQDDRSSPFPELPPPPAIATTRKSFIPDMPPPAPKQPTTRRFTEPTAESTRSLNPIGQTRKLSPFTGACHQSTVHEDANPIIREYRNGRGIIMARQTETDEEGDEASEGYTPTPSSPKLPSKAVELVLKTRNSAPNEEFLGFQGGVGENGMANFKSLEGLSFSRRGSNIEETRPPVIKPSDLRRKHLAKPYQGSERETERPNGFYDRLRKAGIKLSASDLLVKSRDEMSYTSDSSLSDDDSDSDVESRMGDDPSMRKHQRNIRDALREISEVRSLFVCNY